MTTNQPENVILDGGLLSQLRDDIKEVFHVESVETPRLASQGTIVFYGSLLVQDSEAAYNLIAERWHARDYTPLLRRRKDQIALIAQPGVVAPKPSNPWINLGLAVATIVSVWYIGALQECDCDSPQTLAHWLSGLPMMLSMMAILLAHEFGHYFAARYHKIAVTLPYFIPLPIPQISLVGTLGAFIQLRTPFKTKNQLFDIGVAGPLGGLIIAIPLIFWGVSTSPINEFTREPNTITGFLEGNSVFYLITKYVIHGQLLPSFDQYSNLPFGQEFLLLLVGIIPHGHAIDISINSVTLAAWFGLILTAINLMPVGQLDGGHIIYCLFGENARFLGIGIVGVMLVVGIFGLVGLFGWAGWLVWALLILLVIGLRHPPPLNDLPPLGPGRKILAYVMIFVFIIMFMPNPLQFI